MIFGLILTLGAIFALGLSLGIGAFDSLAWLWTLPVGFFGGTLMGCLLALLFLWAICAPVRLEKPQEEDSKFYRVVITAYARFIVKFLRMKLQITGMEKVPKDGRFLLVCNHLYDLDPVALMAVFKGWQLAFISKKENDKKFLVGKALHMILGQPINRENDREALKTILRCVKILKEDKASVAVFPEGYTSRDGLLHPFRSGVFKIAQKAKVPIVVCTLQNTRQVFGNFLRLKSTPIPLHVIDVVEPEQFQDVTTVEIANQIHSMMAQDLGPEKVLQ